jgi:hypothetical protein
MRTDSERMIELERISARILSLNAEKARLDAAMADAAVELRDIFQERVSLPSNAIRAKSNFSDTTTATEIACLLRISERSAHRLVQYSALLVTHHPKTLAALRTGAISWAHATTLLHEYAGLPAGTAAGVEDALLPVAVATTVPRLSYRARRLRTRLHPVALDDRARAAVQERRVDVEPADDAMAWLHVHLRATDAAAIDARLTHDARALQIPTERRTLPQLRTDILTDLLLSEDPPTDRADSPGIGSRVRAHINVTVPVLTLLGVDDAPAELEGYGPIPAEIARRLAAHAPSFTRLLTHPETGAVLSVGRTSYAVPADLRKWLRVRDRTCRHPGCNVPASRCELDHTKPWSQQGPTTHDNLAHLCRKHHKLKSEGIWHYRQSGAGALTATSPGGRTYACDLEPPPF